MDPAAKGERLHVINNLRQKKTQTTVWVTLFLSLTNNLRVCVCVMIAGSRIGINHREIVGGGGYNLFHYFNELCMSCSCYNGLIVPIEVALHLEFK